MAEPFDLDLLNEDDPFEIDDQAAHLLKHPHLGIDDVYDVWRSDPLFYLAKPPGSWSCRSLRRSRKTRARADRSGVTSLRSTSRPATGRTDD